MKEDLEKTKKKELLQYHHVIQNKEINISDEECSKIEKEYYKNFWK